MAGGSGENAELVERAGIVTITYAESKRRRPMPSMESAFFSSYLLGSKNFFQTKQQQNRPVGSSRPAWRLSRTSFFALLSNGHLKYSF